MHKNVAVCRAGERFLELPDEFSGNVNLSRVTAKEASVLLGIDIKRIKAVLQPLPDTGSNSRNRRYDIRLVRSALKGISRPDADLAAVAVSVLQAKLLAGTGKIMPSETADLHYKLTSNVFRSPRHVEPLFRSKTAAQKVLTAMIEERIARTSAAVAEKDFRDSIFVCYTDSRRKPASDDNRRAFTEQCLRAEIHIGHNAAGKSWADLLPEILSAVRSGSKGVSGICDILTDMIYTDGVLKNPIPPIGFENRLYKEYIADPEIGNWFDPERLGRRRHTGRYWVQIKADASKIWPMAEFLSNEAIQALITLFDDPVGFIAQYGLIQKPVDPHGRLPSVYRSDRNVWTNWVNGNAEIVLRNGIWERAMPARVVIGAFNYQVGIFRYGDRVEIHAKNPRGVWLTGRQLERLRTNLGAVGFDLRTGLMFAGGRLMPPQLLFDGVAKGSLVGEPPSVTDYKTKHAEVLQNRRRHNQRHSERRKQRRTPDQDVFELRRRVRELLSVSEDQAIKKNQ